jgi:hypothetical protein
MEVKKLGFDMSMTKPRKDVELCQELLEMHWQERGGGNIILIPRNVCGDDHNCVLGVMGN